MTDPEWHNFAVLSGERGGRRLFPDGLALPNLKLLEAKACRSGVTYSRSSYS